MRIVKAPVVAIVLLGLASSAFAQEYVAVERRRPAGEIILRDTVTGGVLGSAVAGGIILYNMGIQNHSDYDWGRTLAWGAGIGLGAGLVWGVVDATMGSSYSMAAPLPARDGQSMSLDVRSKDESGAMLLPVAAGRF